MLRKHLVRIKILLSRFQIKQLLAVPLLGSNGDVLGMFGVLDRIEAGPINDEDVRRARALAAQIAIALELTHNLHQSEEHRRRAEALVTIALELNSVLHLPEFMRNFALRAAGLLGGRSVALSLFQTAESETVLMRGASEIEDKSVIRRFSQAISVALPKYPAEISFAPAMTCLARLWLRTSGGPIAPWSGLRVPRENWSGCCVSPIAAVAPTNEDHQLLRAIAGHASIALENACLFTRMQQANRHWMDVFDAIGDFIVVHDEQHNILRVNRSLADFVGIAPDQFIGSTCGRLTRSRQAPRLIRALSAARVKGSTSMYIQYSSART